jgi:hypothetical protein
MLLDRALDLVGDRWSLLIVRELMIKPCRYTDLREALSGIATNRLAYSHNPLDVDPSLIGSIQVLRTYVAGAAVHEGGGTLD